MTPALYQVPYSELTCAPKHTLPHHVFRGARRQSVKIGVSKSKRINVAGQGQPKHLNIEHFVSLRPETRDMATRVSGRK